MKKIIRIVVLSLCVLSGVLRVCIPAVSSSMQGYYKSLIDNPEIAKTALEKKRMWANIYENSVYFDYLFIAFICLFLIVELIFWLNKKAKK